MNRRKNKRVQPSRAVAFAADSRKNLPSDAKTLIANARNDITIPYWSGVLQHADDTLIQQGGGAMKSLQALKALLDDRRLTRMQEYISKMSAKMSVVMMLFLFPALLMVLGGPSIIAISRAFGS